MKRLRNSKGIFLPDNKSSEQPRLCACGCGNLTTVFRKKARKFLTGHNSFLPNNPSIGRKHTEEEKRKMSEFQKKRFQNEDPWNKGMFDLNTYYGLHNWVKHELGQPESCEQCGSTNTVEWANKSNEYKHDLSDWLRLCRKCHMRYDAQFGIRSRLYA